MHLQQKIAISLAKSVNTGQKKIKYNKKQKTLATVWSIGYHLIALIQTTFTLKSLILWKQ